MQRSRSPSVTANNGNGRRRSRSGSGSGVSSGSDRAAAAATTSVPPYADNKMNGVSPRGQRKDVLIRSYVMQHQLQGRRSRRSSFFQSLRRRGSEDHDRATQENAIHQESSSSGGDEQRRNSMQRGNGSSSSSTNIKNVGDQKENRLRQRRALSKNNSMPWTLPPHIRLAPRVDVWNILTVSSCAAVASIGQTFANNNNSNSTTFSNWDRLALSTCILTFLSSFTMALGMRYTPFRKNITKSLLLLLPPRQGWNNNNDNYPQGEGRRRLSSVVFGALLQSLTIEFIVVGILSVLWTFSMPVIVNGNAYYNSNSMDGSSWGVPLAVAGYEIWNANLFYSSWISSILCGYLWIEVFTLHDRGGTTLAPLQHHQQDATAVSEDVVDGDARVMATSASSNTFTKRWLFLVCTALIFLSSSISTYTSPVCHGNVLKSSSYCKLALTGIILGGVFQLLITLCVGLLYRLSHTSRRNESNANCSNTEITTILSVHKRDLFASAAAMISLILQIINTAVLTSPMGGGPGSISGTFYFACWMGFVLSFELCLRYLDVYSTAPSEDSVLNARTMSEGDVTVYEDTDDTEDSDRGVGIYGRDEEKANRHKGTHAPKSHVFLQTPQPMESRSPSPASSLRREPSVASSTERSDSEGFANLSQEAPDFNDSSPSIDPEGVLGNSYFTSISMNSRKTNKPYDETRLPVTRKKEPDAINFAFQPKPHPINRTGKLDKGEAKIRRMPSSSSISTKHTNLSPLVEGTMEDASPDEPPPETAPRTIHSNRQVGYNGRMTPTRQGQQQQKQVDRTRTTQSGASSKSSRSRSRENVVRSSYPVSRVGGGRSRHSTTPPQQKTVPVVPALSGNQRYSRFGSGGQSKSPKTVSSRAMESSNSTPDDSGSSPPPTISDEMSSEEDMSEDINKKIIGSTEYRGPPPPPPPFQSPRMNPPMKSIRTSIDGQDETDTIVSEPTLDAGLEDSINTPSPRPTRPKPNSGSQDHHQSSSSTNSYEKKDSDDTNLLTRIHSLSCDEILSSNEGQTGIKVVDDIVAAALAYAETTHGVAAGSRGAAVRCGSGTTAASSQQLPPPIASLTPQSSQKKVPIKNSSEKHQEAKSISASGESSSSVHSFYSKKRGGTQPSSPVQPCSTTAEELLVKALSQAQRGHGNIGEQNHHHQQHRSTRGAASLSTKSGISIKSVYSEEETQFSTRVDYDC